MPLFRKRETYTEQMLREAGLDRVVFREPAPPSEPEPTVPLQVRRPLSSGVPPGWDTTTTASVPGVEGDSVTFTVLPSGDLIVTSDEGDGDLSPLADAIEEHISPPYKASATRQAGDLWGAGASEIAVAQFAFSDADTLVFSHSYGAEELTADGEPSDAPVPPELQRHGETAGADYCVEADRVDGDYWEIRVSPL